MFTSWGRQNTYSRWDTGAVSSGHMAGETNTRVEDANTGHAGTRKNLPVHCGDWPRWDAARLKLLMHLVDTQSVRRSPPATPYTQYHHCTCPLWRCKVDTTPWLPINVTGTKLRHTKVWSENCDSQALWWGFASLFVSLRYCSTILSLLGLQHSLLH